LQGDFFPIYLIPSGNVWENLCFDVIYNLRNSARFHPQNAWNRISGTLDFKHFLGVYSLEPPKRSHAFGVRFAPPPKKKRRSAYATDCAYSGNIKGHHFQLLSYKRYINFYISRRIGNTTF
jgi:hypothetical protein